MKTCNGTYAFICPRTTKDTPSPLYMSIHNKERCPKDLSMSLWIGLLCTGASMVLEYLSKQDSATADICCKE